LRQDARAGILPRLHGSRLLNATAALLGLKHNDPFDNFEWLMDLDEGKGQQATYYFLAGASTRFDGRYDVTSPHMQALLRRVVERGHSIGLHGSYATVDDAEMLSLERTRLATALQAAGVPGEVTAVRQHYLRWRAPLTWRIAESAGLTVDSSLGFNEAPGFRAGTSFEFPAFDVENRRPLRLREKPLHVMDRALSGLDQAAALATIDTIAQEARRHGGTLELLWHNNIFVEDPREEARYLHGLSSAAA